MKTKMKTFSHKDVYDEVTNTKEKKQKRVFNKILGGSLVIAFGFGIAAAFLYAVPKEGNIIFHTPYGSETFVEEDFILFGKQYQKAGKTANTYNDKEIDITDDKEATAKWIQIAFFNYALTGSYKTFGSDSNNDGKPDAIEGTILKPSSESSWLAPNINDPSTLINNAFEVKFYTDTTGSAKNANTYLIELAKTDPNITYSCGTYFDPKYKTLWNMKNDSTVGIDYYNACMSTISKNMDFLLSTLDFLYVYSYLWQETPKQENAKNVYDYYLTEELFVNKPAFMWKADVSKMNEYGKSYYDGFADSSFAGIRTGIANNGQVPGTPDNPQSVYIGSWSQLKGSNRTNSPSMPSNVTINEYSTLTGDTWDIGFLGIEYKSSSAVVTNGSFWDVSNAYQWYNTNSTTPSEGVDYTGLNKFGPQSFADPQVYKEENVVITPEGSTDGTGSIVSGVLIYPFVFADGYRIGTGGPEAEKWYYSIYAYEIQENSTSNKYYIPVGGELPPGMSYWDRDASTTGAITTTPSESLVSVFDLFSTNGWYVTNFTPTFLQEYIVYDLYLKNIANLQNKAYSYWNYKGFYITLTGDCYNDYSSLINVNLQSENK